MGSAGRSIPGHRGQLLLAIRAPHHVAAAAAAYGRTRRKRWQLLGAAAVAPDVALWHRVRHDDELAPDRRVRAAVDAVDAAVWATATLSADAPEAVRYHSLAAIVPTAIEEAMRLRSGGVASPPFAPATPWPLPRGRGAVPALARALLPAVVPVAVTRAVRRRSGRTSAAGEDLGWVLLAGAGGYLLARSRDRLHREARERWADAVDGAAAAEVMAMEAVVANRQTSGHEFKGIFSILATLLDRVGDEAGTALAMTELQRVQDLEQQAFDEAAAELGGTLLAHVAQRADVEVHPVWAGVVWLSDPEAARLESFVHEADEAAAAAADGSIPIPRIEVRRCGWDRALVEVSGQRAWFGSSDPQLEANVDPARVGFVLGAAWKATGAFPRFGSVPWPYVAAAIGLDLDNLRRHLADPTLSTDDEPPAAGMFARSLGSMAIYALPTLARSTPERTPDGWPLNPPAEHGTLLLLGHYWHHLSPTWRRTVVAACAALWLAKGARPERRGVPGRGWELLAEAMNPLSVFLCALNLDRRVGRESDDLEEALAAEHLLEVDTARRAVLGDYVTELRRQLEIASDLRLRLVRQADGDPELSDALLELRQRIKQFEQWIDRVEVDDADAPEGRTWDPPGDLLTISEADR